MENMKKIENYLNIFGIRDNMILPDTINISGNFIYSGEEIKGEEIKKIDRMKIKIEFEVKLV